MTTYVTMHTEWTYAEFMDKYRLSESKSYIFADLPMYAAVSEVHHDSAHNPPVTAHLDYG